MNKVYSLNVQFAEKPGVFVKLQIKGQKNYNAGFNRIEHFDKSFVVLTL